MTVYEFPMVDRDPLDRWSFGRVTLLGDAAHPMSSNCASQAIIDGRVIAIHLATNDDPEAALQAYKAGRRRTRSYSPIAATGLTK